MTASLRLTSTADLTERAAVLPFPAARAAASRAASPNARQRPDIWRIVRRFGHRRIMPEGAILHSPGDQARHLFVVEDGRLEVFRPGEMRRVSIASFRPGDCFSFDFGGFRVGSCEAVKRTTLVGLPIERLREATGDDTEVERLLRECHAFELSTFLDAHRPGSNSLHRPASTRPQIGGAVAPAP